MDTKSIDADYVVRAALAVDIQLNADHVPGVVQYFRMIAGMAASLNEFPLDASDESATHFTPCSPPPRD